MVSDGPPDGRGAQLLLLLTKVFEPLVQVLQPEAPRLYVFPLQTPSTLPLYRHQKRKIKARELRFIYLANAQRKGFLPHDTLPVTRQNLGRWQGKLWIRALVPLHLFSFAAKWRLPTSTAGRWPRRWGNWQLPNPSPIGFCLVSPVLFYKDAQ